MAGFPRVSEISSVSSQEDDGDDQQNRKPRTLFADADEMKAKLRDQLSKPEYNVSMYYHKRGIAQHIARSAWFEQATLVVISLNAVWVFIDTDYNSSDTLAEAPLAFQLVEQVFCFYFAFEWLIRFLAFRSKLDTVRDAWFVFDTLLTLLIIVDSWFMYLYMKITGVNPGQDLSGSSSLRILRLIRLTRMARIAHLLKVMPELGILLRGLGAAMRSVGFTLVLLSGLLYIFGMAFRYLCSNVDHVVCTDFFSSVPQSMHTLLIYGTLMDSLTSLVTPLEEYNIALLMFFYLFLLLANLTIMNMLIGVLCEVVNTTATIERESVALHYVRQRIQKIIHRGGMGDVLKGDAKIDKQEFLTILGNPDAADVLKRVGVDVIGLVDFADFIFKQDVKEFAEDKLLSFADFVEVVLELRGNNVASVRDIVDLRKFVQLKVHTLENKLDYIAGRQRSAASKMTGRPRMSNQLSIGGVDSLNSLSAIKHKRSTNSDNASIETSDFPHDDQEHASPMHHSESAASNQMQRAQQHSAKGDHVAPGSEFRYLMDSLIVERERTLASMQRQNERLQVELEVLKSTENSFGHIHSEASVDRNCPSRYECLQDEAEWRTPADDTGCLQVHQTRVTWDTDMSSDNKTPDFEDCTRILQHVSQSMGGTEVIASGASLVSNDFSERVSAAPAPAKSCVLPAASARLEEL